MNANPEFLPTIDGALVRRDHIVSIGPESEGSHSATLSGGRVAELSPDVVRRLLAPAPLHKTMEVLP